MDKITQKGCKVIAKKLNIYISKIKELNILGIYLYGSRYKGTHKPNSDFDVCVLLSNSGTNLVMRYNTELNESLTQMVGIKVSIVFATIRNEWTRDAIDITNYNTKKILLPSQEVMPQNKVHMENLNYGQAIEAVKDGKLIFRSGWNSAEKVVFMRPADELTVNFVNGVRSLPESIKGFFTAKVHGSEKIKFSSYLCMTDVGNIVINGWLPSHADMLSDDWCILLPSVTSNQTSNCD